MTKMYNPATKQPLTKKMPKKIINKIRKISEQLCISTPSNIDCIFAEHLLNQISSRINQQGEDTKKAESDFQFYRRSHEDTLERLSAMSAKLDNAIMPYTERIEKSKERFL